MTERRILTEAEIEERISLGGAASALAGHEVDEHTRETGRRMLRGEITIEEAIEGAYQRAVATQKNAPPSGEG
ncbi:MAG: antitoxin VbhA family protein [Mycobacteriaceae bacterium]|nr:antitoxin VbhA family protein [Mycobacteriaceae bacterium]